MPRKSPKRHRKSPKVKRRSPRKSPKVKRRSPRKSPKVKRRSPRKSPRTYTSGLSKKDRKTQKKEIKKSIKKYKDGKYHLRKKLKSFKSRKSPHILKARKVYGLEDIKPSHQLAIKTKCSLKGLKKIVKKGQGAYFSSGSRPNQTPHSWGYARLASAITGGNASKVDFHIIEKECNKNGKAYKLAKKKLKFKMQSQTYNKDDFKEGDEFERITWHWLGARTAPGACVDRKNKSYPRVISVHPSYIYTNILVSTRPNRYARVYYNLMKDVVWKGGIIKSAPKRPKSAMKKSGGRVKRRSPHKKARSPRKKPPSPRKVKAAKKIQKYVRKRSGRRKNKFKMQEFIRWRSKPRSRELEERKYPIGRWPYYLQDETRVFRDELGRNFNKGDFRIGDVIEAINIDGRSPLRDCSILSSNNNELTLLTELPGEYHGKNRYIVSYDDIREVIFRKSSKRPKSAMKKSGGRVKRRSPRKKARSPRKKPPSPRKVKAAKKIQKYVRKRRKNKFKMQDQNLIRVFRDDLGRDFNKHDFHSNQVLQVLDIVDNWPKWDVRIKSAKNNGLEIFTESEDTQLIPYANIREVIYQPPPKRPKSAGKYKMQDDVDYVTITVNNLGRNFNKDDFYVGQIVDIRRNGRGWSGYKHKIKNIDNFGVDWSLMKVINGHERRGCWGNYNSINSVRYYKEKKKPKSAMKKGKYKMQNNTDYITVTVKDLGRNFNKDDFYVGQIIDLRRENRSWQEEKFTVRNLDDTSIYWAGTPPHFWARIAKPWHMKYDSIYSVRYYKEKKNLNRL